MTITSDTVLIAHWTETSVDEDDDKNDALAVGDELETDQGQSIHHTGRPLRLSTRCITRCRSSREI